MRTETIGNATLHMGDCRELLPTLPAGDVVITDPPYGVTSLEWDQIVTGWPELVRAPCMWVFGSWRYFQAQRFDTWTYAQEIVWEKHNGSIFHADRFRRVHEFAVQFYRGGWAALHKAPVYTLDATARTTRRKKRPAHSGQIEAGAYVSEDGGPRLQRSVIYARSCHGSAEHPTQKPVEIVLPLVNYSCPPGGMVIDPFMGSGTTGIACLSAERQFVGIEIDEKYFDVACRRIDDAQRQARLFA